MTDRGELAEERRFGQHCVRWYLPRLCAMEIRGDMLDGDAAAINDFHRELSGRAGGILLMVNLQGLGRFPASARKLAADTTNIQFLGTALYGGSQTQRVLAVLLINAINLFSGRNDLNPTQYCASEEAAWEFLRRREQTLQTSAQRGH